LSEAAYAAVDLGAESGRVVVGRIRNGAAALDVVHRFPNVPVRLPDGLHWNLLGLFEQTLLGLARAAAQGTLAGVGVDAWGVDYALLEPDGRMLGPPFHYRDSRTNGMVARAHERVPREDMYAATGIQTLPINTVFQLLADECSSALTLRSAERIALIPDLFAYWLSGALINEQTAASTTGLVDARSGSWARDIIRRLGLPTGPFVRDLTEPGTTLGPLMAIHAPARDAVGVPVHVVAGHDTASAFVAAPMRRSDAAVLSSGTWSLLGVEVDEPVLTREAAAHNLSNERGFDGTTRLLANVMGLWLVQECRRHWQAQGAACDYGELLAMAAVARADVPVFDPDDEVFLAPGDMPRRIADACRATDQAAPTTPGEFVRSVLLSLSCKYRIVLERLERVTGRSVGTIHVIGGGARNDLLCQLTASTLERSVLAGPVEATALGNILVQARATGQFSSLAELREVSARSAQLRRFEPSSGDTIAEENFERFAGITGLSRGPSPRAPRVLI
jgi:rhamnulokinase